MAHQRDYESAERCFSMYLALARTQGDKHEESVALLHLGYTALSQSKLDQARSLFEQSADQALVGGDIDGALMALGEIGKVALAQGEHSIAKQYWQKALALARQQGNPPNISVALIQLATVDLEAQRFDAAEEALREAASFAEANGLPDLAAIGLYHLVRMYISQDRTEHARSTGTHCLKLLDEIDDAEAANFKQNLSDHCCSMVTYALERYQRGEAKALPILLKPVDVVGAPFSELEMLPKGGKPVTSWDDPDKAYAHITYEIRKVVYDLLGLSESLNDIRKKPDTAQDAGGSCPYLGVKPYSEHDAPLFFGRDTYVGDLMRKLSCDQRLLLVLGPIGSGKTSVLQAGVIPLLRKGSKFLPQSFNWEILNFIPDESPSSKLLFLLGIQDPMELIEGIKLWRSQHSKSKRLVLVLDQFEELFKLAPPQERKSFLSQLLKLIIHDLATILIAMSDPYDSDLARYVDFITIAEQYISNIPPLQSEEILHVITKPAQEAHLHFEDHLAEKIAGDAMRSTQEPKEHRRSRHASVLPLLSVCLEQLWQRQKDHYVTVEDYEAVGQVSGALAMWATEAFHQLDEKQQDLARRIFVDLVALGDESEGRVDCRRQKPLTKLYSHRDEMSEVRDVVEKLAKAHLLEMQLNEQKELEVKIIHESLLREWSLLRDWLRKDYQFLLWHQEFEHQLQKWLGSNENINQRDISYLLRGRRLTEAQQWIAEQPHRFPHEAQDFIRASSTQEEQAEQREKALQHIQERQRMTQAKHLATKALLLQEQEPRLLRKSLLIAIEAMRRHHCVEADQALRRGLTVLPRLDSRTRLLTTGQTVLFSNNGESLATAGPRGVYWLNHVGSSDECNGTDFLGNTHTIALSDNGEYLLAGVSTGVTWLLHTMKRCRVAMIRHNAHICCVALTHRQPYIAAIGYDNGKIGIYQFINIDEPATHLSENDLVQHAKQLHTFHHDQAVSSLSFSHDDRYLISGGMDRTVRVWKKEGGPSLDTCDVKSPICTTLVSPDDTSIAILCEDGRAFVWQWKQQSRRIWQRMQSRVRSIPQAEKIQAVAFGAGRNCLATASVDGFARIWNLEDMTEVKVFCPNSPVSSLCCHQGKDWLATAGTDGNVKIYSVVEDKPRYIIPHDTSVLSIAFNAQKPYIATVDRQGCVWIWQLYDGNFPLCFRHEGKVVHLLFDHDKNGYVLRLAITFCARLKVWTIALDSLLASHINEHEHFLDWRTTDDERGQASSQENNTMRVFSCDGRYLAEITPYGLLKVAKTSSNSYENMLKVNNAVELCTFSHDGEYLAFVGDENQILLWKWKEKMNQPRVLFHVEHARDLVFSTDDEYLIVAENNNRIIIWQWKKHIKEPDLILHHEESVRSLSLCSHKQYLLTFNIDTNARVWDMTTGLLAHHLPHKGEVVSATFDSEGKYVATASTDGCVGIWDLATGEQLARLPHEERAYAVAFSKNGRYLATACDDSIIRIWQWKQSDLEKEAKLRLMSNLTYEEWQEYIGNEPYRETFDDLGWRELSSTDPFDSES